MIRYLLRLVLIAAAVIAPFAVALWLAWPQLGL